MTLESQVCSLDLAKRLKELGVKQDGIWKWYISNDGKETILSNGGKLPNEYLYSFTELCSAFTTSELGEMLPRQVDRNHWTEHIRGKVSGWISFLRYVEHEKTWDLESFEAATEADARAKMLIYLLKNKLITV